MKRAIQGYFTLFLMLAANVAFAQNGSIKGVIRTADQQPAKSAAARIKGTSKLGRTNSQGEFEITSVSPGTYTVLAQMMGYETKELNVTVNAGETTTVPDIILVEKANKLDDVEITGNAKKYNATDPSAGLRLNGPLIEAPQNIQVITKDAIADQQAFDMLEGVQRNVSGAQKVEHWDNYARINMRGSQVTAFRNGMNVTMPWGPLAEDMSMVERIEFVKGPAGFMLSSGEPSGFYNVVTKKPTGRQQGGVTFSLGSFDTYRATADFDGKFSEKVLYRINVMSQLKGSHRDYEYNNRYSVVPVIKYLINDNSALTMEYTHQFSEMNVIGSNYAFSKRGFADLPVNYTTAEPNLEPTRINDRSLMGTFEHKLNDRWKITAQAAYFNYSQIGQSIWPQGFAITNDSFMQRGISIWDALGMRKTGQAFLNGSARTGKINHNILGGVDMANQDYYADWNQGAKLGDSTFNIYKPAFGRVSAAEIPSWDRSKDILVRGVRYNNSYSAVYVQDELGFFENKLRLTVAGRYTTLKDVNPYSGNTSDGKFTPRAGVSYSVTKTASTYVVYDQSFMGNPGADWQGNSFKPLTGTNMEWGAKMEWFKGRLNTEVSAYQITKNNVLTADLEHANSTGQFVFSKQTGQQQAKGIEVDIKGQLGKNLDLIVNYAYTDARITKDSDTKLIGNQIAGATKHLQNAWLSYKIDRGMLDGLKLSVGYQFQSGRSSWYIFDGSENKLPDYFRLDGSVAYQKDNFGISLIVNNLLNEYLFTGAPYYGMYYWQTEAMRNGRLTISYKF